MIPPPRLIIDPGPAGNIMDDERRQFKRVPLETKLRFRRLEAKESFVEASSEKANLSVGGVFIPTKLPLQKGTIVEVEWAVPARRDKIAVLGKVAWVGEADGVPGMGIEFLKMDPVFRDDIIRYAKRGQWRDSNETLPAVPPPGPKHDVL